MTKWEYREIEKRLLRYPVQDGDRWAIGSRDNDELSPSGGPLAPGRDWGVELKKRKSHWVAWDADAGNWDMFWDVVKRYGLDGWELVSVHGHHPMGAYDTEWTFKRPIPPGA